MLDDEDGGAVFMFIVCLRVFVYDVRVCVCSTYVMINLSKRVENDEEKALVSPRPFLLLFFVKKR